MCFRSLMRAGPMVESSPSPPCRSESQACVGRKGSDKHPYLTVSPAGLLIG